MSSAPVCLCTLPLAQTTVSLSQTSSSGEAVARVSSVTLVRSMPSAAMTEQKRTCDCWQIYYIDNANQLYRMSMITDARSSTTWTSPPLTHPYPSQITPSPNGIHMHIHVHILAYITLNYTHPSPFTPPKPIKCLIDTCQAPFDHMYWVGMPVSECIQSWHLSLSLSLSL